jgi:metallophosphoesterase (TIGR03767 family)
VLLSLAPSCGSRRVCAALKTSLGAHSAWLPKRYPLSDTGRDPLPSYRNQRFSDRALTAPERAITSREVWASGSSARVKSGMSVLILMLAACWPYFLRIVSVFGDFLEDRLVRGKSVVILAAGLSLVAMPAVAHAGSDDQTGKTTLEETIKKKGSGYIKVVKGEGEKYVVRTDMKKPGPKRAQRRESLAFFGQLTDPQVADEMSPARTELVDPAAGSISAAWRPQEALGVRVFDSIIRNMNANKTSRVRQGNGARAKLQFSLLTGDVADSQQYNEVRWFRQVLDGKKVNPHSGKKITATNTCGGATQDEIDQMNAEVAAQKYVGVQDFSLWPGQNKRYQGYWDPNIGGGNNEYGYGSLPKYPGLMDKAQTKMKAAGLDFPWYVTRGNHDTLVQGNVPANLDVAGLPIGGIATGCRKPWPNNLLNPGLLVGIPSGDVFERLTQPDMIAGVVYGLFQMRKVSPDPDRRYVSKVEFKENVGSDDNQHGFNYVSKSQAKSSRGNASYYAFNRGPFRIIMLDTNAEGGGASGNIDQPQYKWLQKQLDKYSNVEIRNGKIKRDSGKNKMLIIGSHHTLATMDNPRPDEAAGICDDAMEPGCDSDPRDSKPIHLGVSGEKPLLDLLLRFPNVVGYVNGHTHHNFVKTFLRPKGSDYRSGFWQINTASHVDWPQQSRTIEIMDNKDNTLSIFGTILNSAAPIKAPKAGTNAKDMTNKELASLSRRLSINDPQTKDVTEGGGAGKKMDRNVELVIKDPRSIWKKSGGLG